MRAGSCNLPPWEWPPKGTGATGLLRSGAASGRIARAARSSHLATMADAAQSRRDAARDGFHRDLMGADQRERELIKSGEEVERARIESYDRLVREAQLRYAQTRKADGGVDAGGPGPGLYLEITRLESEIASKDEELKDMSTMLQSARNEIARLNKALQDELRAQRDSAVAELAQKKRRRVDDDAAAN